MFIDSFFSLQKYYLNYNQTNKRTKNKAFSEKYSCIFSIPIASAISLSCLLLCKRTTPDGKRKGTHYPPHRQKKRAAKALKKFTIESDGRFCNCKCKRYGRPVVDLRPSRRAIMDYNYNYS